MKRSLVISVVAIFLLFGALLFSLLPIKANLFSAAYAQQATWYRNEYYCPPLYDGSIIKVTCTLYGAEQCTAKYCNSPM